MHDSISNYVIKHGKHPKTTLEVRDLSKNLTHFSICFSSELYPLTCFIDKQYIDLGDNGKCQMEQQMKERNICF